MGGAFGKRKVQVLVVGLDNSGKTSIINALKNEKNATVAPTVGFNKDSVEKFNLNFQFSDMSGQNQYRGMWEQYATKIDGLIFVIDSSDKIRFGIALDEFKLLLETPGFSKDLPILVYANKQDSPDAQNPQFFIDYLELKQYKNPSQCFAGSAKTGVGLDQGLEWLSAKIQQVKPK
ncbi:unnamed protein product (macronuclear) [Paramecium tetraurelia]|uniref:ADP-ribosylation factor-like protein 6 n=1 Tax=Paramecium tetraurelia TaxID=5888 RepID=Q3SDN3_PARTE|nr:uncharacterized protein GSPATT00038302001 [Paramecium tetraurelia]CAI39325.1 arl_A64 [Paramecium tetraurelia]CAK70200.1 unnamed protein product [Paramecium tetraurelia]|eukprot:XP_001437597.1 hypothetical protein (macronuclear) [Paramecium tetraurelia strain d4-2]